MRIAINGFGRIGRAAFKIILKTPRWSWSRSTTWHPWPTC